jgi:hypothetical protein
MGRRAAAGELVRLVSYFHAPPCRQPMSGGGGGGFEPSKVYGLLDLDRGVGSLAL